MPAGASARADCSNDGGQVVQSDVTGVGKGDALGPIVGPGLDVLFVGINPSLRSAEVGHHFARPGNRFWPTLHAAGFTPRRLRPDEDAELPAHRVGVTNLVFRPTREAAELTSEELREGAIALERTVRRYQPRLVAVAGLTAYRTAFSRPRATMGLQPHDIGGRPVWVLPNPSGLNAHYKPADFARLYAEARVFAEAFADGAKTTARTTPARRS
jgi:double-stranded uracil-DNA glycosylase